MTLYSDKLLNAVQQAESVLCVGLDPRPSMIPGPVREQFEDPAQMVEHFCGQVIEATQEYCCAYKPNIAFFEALGPQGMEVFARVLQKIPDNRIVIADVKRGDIGATAGHYKTAYFDCLNVDAVTLNPMMGFDTLEPWLQEADKAVYSLVLTSNPGSHDMLLRRFEGRLTLAEYIADQLARKSRFCRTHIGMVVGATHPADMERVLAAYPDASLLVPGVGSQGGSPEELEKVLEKHRGIPVISSSRSILYAGGDRVKWKDDVAASAKKLKSDLKKIGKRFYK